jgi:hypothetical protein
MHLRNNLGGWGLGLMMGSCKYVNEPSGYIKRGDFLNQTGDCQLLKKKDSDP